MNNEYLNLPQHLQNVSRSADDHLFHEDGRDLSAGEYAEIIAAWQEHEVLSGAASWDNEPCEKCGQVVCICKAYPEATFKVASH